MQKVSNFKTAAAYAEAWFDAAKDMKTEDTVFEEVRALREGIGDVIALWNSMAAPIEAENDQIDVITALAKKIKLSQVSEETLKLVAKNNRLRIIPLILNEFIRLYYQHKGIVEVFAESAIALNEEQNNKLKKILENKLNAPVVIDYHVNPEVLGGLSIRFASYLIDDTVRSKLLKLEQLLAKGN
ncbi:MAG: ATP synthase F1 subunit delta [Acetobacter sp.]|nr:ATP synthase F1 subunit delta [Acetobacter sp.]